MAAASFKLDKTPHPTEGAFLDAVALGGGKVDVVKDARAAGLPWQTIWQTILTYGPQAWAILQAIVTALNTPSPAMLAVQEALKGPAVDPPPPPTHRPPWPPETNKPA
jgi:hypothetical protein